MLGALYSVFCSASQPNTKRWVSCWFWICFDVRQSASTQLKSECSVQERSWATSTSWNIARAPQRRILISLHLFYLVDASPSVLVLVFIQTDRLIGMTSASRHRFLTRILLPRNNMHKIPFQLFNSEIDGAKDAINWSYVSASLRKDRN